MSLQDLVNAVGEKTLTELDSILFSIVAIICWSARSRARSTDQRATIPA